MYHEQTFSYIFPVGTFYGPFHLHNLSVNYTDCSFYKPCMYPERTFSYIRPVGTLYGLYHLHTLTVNCTDC